MVIENWPRDIANLAAVEPVTPPCHMQLEVVCTAYSNVIGVNIDLLPKWKQMSTNTV